MIESSWQVVQNADNKIVLTISNSRDFICALDRYKDPIRWSLSLNDTKILEIIKRAQDRDQQSNLFFHAALMVLNVH